MAVLLVTLLTEGVRYGFCTRPPIRASRWPISFEQAGKLGLMGTFGGTAINGAHNGPSAAGCHPEAWRRCKNGPLTRAFTAERVTRIELA
jgi:hypothetical protein